MSVNLAFQPHDITSVHRNHPRSFRAAAKAATEMTEIRFRNEDDVNKYLLSTKNGLIKYKNGRLSHPGSFPMCAGGILGATTPRMIAAMRPRTGGVQRVTVRLGMKKLTMKRFRLVKPLTWRRGPAR